MLSALYRRMPLVVMALLTAGCSTATGQAIVDLATIRPAFESFFESRRIESGAYGQYRMHSSSSTPDYYASLDVAVSRTVMGEDFTTSLSDTQRGEWIEHLQSFALPNGQYSSTFGHNQLHANGMTVGGLGSLGGKQLYPADPLYAPFDEPSEVGQYLENSINWSDQWSQSHKFWGGLHVYSLSSRATGEWQDAVFDWLDTNVDSTTGWWRTGQQPSSDVQGLGGGAHIWPIYEHLGRDFPEPERVIDRILDMQLDTGRFGNGNSGYMDLDALYGLKFMRSHVPSYRASEIDQAVEDFGLYLNSSISGFLASGPSMHATLAKVGGFGLLNQLAPELFPDSTGVAWTDIFTDPKLYLTSEVETFSIDLSSVGADSNSVYSSVIAAANPVAYWRLGQTGGIGAPDSMGNENLTGIYVGLGTGAGPANLGQPGPRPSDGLQGMGSDNRSPHMDGNLSYVSTSDTAELDITDELTMEAWIKLDGLPDGNGGIVAKYEGSSAQRSYSLYVDVQNGGTGGLGMAISPDGSFTNAKVVTDDNSLPIGEWIHVAGVFKSNDFMRLYVNGQLVEQLSEALHDVPSNIFSSSSDLWIGTQFSTSSSFRFPGGIDEVALYDRALTSEEILDHFLVASDLPGDFNRDGVVNIADYTVWRDSLGQTGTALSVDADRSGSVTTADYMIWKDHFGATATPTRLSQATVPSPSSGLLAGIASFVVLSCVRRRRLDRETKCSAILLR